MRVPGPHDRVGTGPALTRKGTIMYHKIVTDRDLIAEIADHFPATLAWNNEDRLVTASDGIPVSILGVTRDECGDPIRAAVRVEAGTPDDWLTGTADLSEYATMSPDAQMCDLLAAHDRAVAAALTDAADETLRAMAGDWVPGVGVVVRASQDDECLTEFGECRGFEVRARLCTDELEPDQWPNPYSDEPDGHPLTADHAAEIAARALELDGRVLDAWIDQSTTDAGDLSVWKDSTWDGRPIVWVSAAAEDADDFWPSVGVTVTLQADGRDITAGIWDGPRPEDEFDTAALNPRQALTEALGRLLGRALPKTEPGDGLLARWSREASSRDA